MRRPYISYKIVQLEDLFSSAKGNAKLLQSLQAELRHRNVPRAVALLEQVDAGIASLHVDASDKPAMAPQPELPTKQPDLWANRQSTSLQFPEKLTMTPTKMQSASESSSPNQNEATNTERAPGMSHGDTKISIEEAYRLLKVTATSKWETIELARRTIVQAAHPDAIAKLAGARQEELNRLAKQANAAYLMLLADRSALSAI